MNAKEPRPERGGTPDEVREAGETDPRRTRRVVLGSTASLLMFLSIFFTDLVFGFADGSHTDLIRSDYGGREVLIAVIGLGAGWFVFNPFRPDPRVAQAAMLAAGIVAVAVGFTQFTAAYQVVPQGPIVEASPGPQAWMLLAAGALFVTLRFRRSLWPDSPWEAVILDREPRQQSRRRR